MAVNWIPISTKYEDRTLIGDYSSNGLVVTVRTMRGSKQAPLTGLSATYLAKILLRQLEREGRA